MSHLSSPLDLEILGRAATRSSRLKKNFSGQSGFVGAAVAPPPEAPGTQCARTRVTRVAMSDLNVTAPPFAPPDSNRVDVPARDNHVAPHPPTPTRDIEGVRGDDDSRIRRPGAGHHRRRGDARGEGELRAGPRALPAAHVHARAGGAAGTPARAGGSGRREEKGAAGREFEFNAGAVREAARRRRHRAAAAAAAATRRRRRPRRRAASPPRAPPCDAPRASSAGPKTTR